MKTIAISGKGGSGKTTIAALIIRWLSEQAAKSILAVDADSNVNLNEILGVEISETIGAIREEMKSRASQLPGGMTKQQFLEYKIQASLSESAKFDLIAMGRPEGPGCYCYSNNLLRDILNTLSTNYDYVVIDNEAGMEHLSRRTTQNIDHLLIVSNPTLRGIHAAGKISRLLEELDTRIDKKYILLNRVQGSVPKPVQKVMNDEGLSLISTVPEDDRLFKMDQTGQHIWDIPPKSPANQAIRQFMIGLMHFEEGHKVPDL
jgi:CO dehydrogenase maturation factor